MAKEFKYILSFNDADPVELEHYPDFDNGQTRDQAREAGRHFYRSKISGAFIFARHYFDLINDRPDDTKFTLEIFSKWPTEAIFISEDILVFYKNDAENIDEDLKHFVVQPPTLDKYKAILDATDKEFEIIDNVPTVPVNYKLRPVFQFVAIAETTVQSVLTNVFGGLSFEQELITVPAGPGDLNLNYNFGECVSIGQVTGENLDPDISGTYQASPSGWLRVSDGAYRITLAPPQIATSNLQVIEVSSGSVVYEAIPPGTSAPRYDDWELNSLSSSATARFITRLIYGRYVTNQEIVNGVNTDPLPANDIVSPPAGLTRCIALGSSVLENELPLDITTAFLASDGNQAEPTRYGKFPIDGAFFASHYYTKPASSTQVLPISRSRWGDASFWFNLTPDFEQLQIDGAEDIQVQGYLFSDVLAYMLGEVAPGVSHLPDSSHSQLLYTENDIRGEVKAPVFIPKNRILASEEQEPDRRYFFRLSDVFSMLEIWKAGWHISDDNKFVIEGSQYYYNGRHYTIPQIGLNVSELIEGRTGKSWAYHANNYRPEKVDIPVQIRTQWTDDSSQPFRGFPIDIRSPFADQSRYEDIIPSQFSADLDFMLIAGADRVSRNGFLYCECELAGQEYTIPIAEVNLGSLGPYTLQNPYSSWIWMQDRYYIYVMPADLVTINLEDRTAESVIRSKIQSLEIPSFQITEPYKLITTGLGTGALRNESSKRDGSGGSITIEL